MRAVFQDICMDICHTCPPLCGGCYPLDWGDVIAVVVIRACTGGWVVPPLSSVVFTAVTGAGYAPLLLLCFWNRGVQTCF